jgi:hypothetical protein
MIKIYPLIILLSLFTVFAKAQFVIGQRVLGGTISFSTGKNENVINGNTTTNYSNFFISPSIAKFKKANVLRGIGFSYGYSYQKSKYNFNPTDTRQYNNSVGVNLFSQRFLSVAQNLSFTIQTGASVAYTFGRQISTINNVENVEKSKGYNLGVGVAPGLSYKLSDRFLFDAYLNNLLNTSYSHSETKYTNQQGSEITSTDNNFHISSSLSNTSLGYVGLGFRWLLKK